MKKLLFVLVLLISTWVSTAQSTLHVSKVAVIEYNKATRLWEASNFRPVDLDFQQERYKISVNDHNKSVYNLLKIIGVSSRYTTWEVQDEKLKHCVITINKDNDIPILITVFYDNVRFIYYISSVSSPETTRL